MRRRGLLVGLGAAVAACAPIVQGALSSSAFHPSLADDRFVSFDGAALGLTSWPAQGEPWAVIVGLHGMNDYAGAFHMAGPWWGQQGIATYAYDQRGFGRSPQRGVWAGRDLMAEDLRTACALARQRHPQAIIAVAGESMGGAVAIAAFASDRPPDADRLVLLSPAVWGWSQQPGYYHAMSWMSAHLARSYVVQPPRFLTSRIWASDNIRELIAMGRDRQMIFGSRFDTLYGLVGLMEAAWRDIGQVRAPTADLPTAYLYGAHDQIIPKAAAFSAAHRLSAPGRTLYYDEGWHLLLRDLQAEAVWRDVAAFIRDPSAAPPSGAPPIPTRVPKPSKAPDLPPGVGANGKITLGDL